MAAVYSDLEGQVLLVTGGGSGIGESIVATPDTVATIIGLITPVGTAVEN